MAEAWLNYTCNEFFEAESAGLEPGTLNPLAVKVMAEVGIDISRSETRAVVDVFKSGQLFFLMSLPYAMLPVPSGVQFFRASRNVCIGVFLILRP